ncbi:MAG: hypothetical protein JO132_17670 [Streptosporangiaceae bacterium]|nr:hypothetical protein [Streptosporangiaceae bacterium]
MTDVACFCGCFYSFEGGAGACPKCGQVAAVTAGPLLESTGRGQREQPEAYINGAGQNGQAAGTCRERAGADPDSLAGIVIAPDSGPARVPVLPGIDRP